MAEPKRPEKKTHFLLQMYNFSSRTFRRRNLFVATFARVPLVSLIFRILSAYTELFCTTPSILNAIN